MFIRPASDLHNEFSTFKLPSLETDSRSVLLLAGDIGLAKVQSTLTPFLDSVTDRFTDVLYIPGNHEYYHDGSLIRVDVKLEEICRRYLNVHYLNRKTIKIGNVRFIGATLWTDMNNGDPMVIMTAQEQMNDYRRIRTGTLAEPYRRKIRPVDTLGLNIDHRHFIKTELEKARENGEKVVVMTHHSPSFLSRPQGMRHGLLDYAYYNCGLESLIEEYRPAVWVHGHSHYPADYMIGNTRIVSNPRGYSYGSEQDEGLGFLPNLVIEL